MANRMFLVTHLGKSLMKCFGETKYAACAYVSGVKNIPVKELNAFPLKPKRFNDKCKHQPLHSSSSSPQPSC
jgi:hypothetical protein